MKMSKLSNHTNSQDPQAVNSRVFVGNLNTFQCSKTDVERMFQKYGRLAGISMHKGYAFVQFTNPFDARNACLGEDGRNVLGQILDVNIVAEPKEHQIGRKRQNNTKTGNDWDYYYDSYYTSTVFPGRAIIAPRPIKRQRLMTPQQARQNLTTNTRVHSPQQQIFLPANMISNGNCSPIFPMECNFSNGEPRTILPEASANGIHYPPQQNILGAFKVYSTPDTLICGNCKELFSGIGDLLEHKQSFCKLRFVCKCKTNDSKKRDSSSTNLLCALCKGHFTNAWDLMVHVQEAHMLNIYDLGTDLETNNNNTEYIDNAHCQTSTRDIPLQNVMSPQRDMIDQTENHSELIFNMSSEAVHPSTVDLKLNSVESTVLSCSSRESSLSPQTVLSNLGSQRGLLGRDDIIEQSVAETALPCSENVTSSLPLDGSTMVVAL